MKHTWLFAFAFMFLLALPPPAAWAGNAIGNVEVVRNDAYGTPPTADKRTKKWKHNDVVSNELIETDGGATILIILFDKTSLLIGERSKMVIDEYVYDPETRAGKAIFSFTLGAIRFVSGRMAKNEVIIQTPTASIGLRGSDALIMVTPEGATTIDVFRGVFTVRKRDLAGRSVTVKANQNATVSADGKVSDATDGFTTPAKSARSRDKTGKKTKETDYKKELKNMKPGGKVGGRGYTKTPTKDKDKDGDGPSLNKDGNGHDDDHDWGSDGGGHDWGNGDGYDWGDTSQGRDSGWGDHGGHDSDHGGH